MELLIWALLFSLVWVAWILAWKAVFPDVEMGSRQYFITWLLGICIFVVVGRLRRRPK